MLDSATGVISGTPTTADDSTFEVTVKDKLGSTETAKYTLKVNATSPFPMSYTMTVDGSLTGWEGEEAQFNNVFGADVTITGTRAEQQCVPNASYCLYFYRAETMTGTDFGYTPESALAVCSFPFTVNIVAEPHYLDGNPTMVLGESDGVIKGALDIGTDVQNHPECDAGLVLGSEGTRADADPFTWPLSQTVSPGAETSTWSVEDIGYGIGPYFDGVITITWHW